MSASRKRLDHLVVENNLAPTGAKAQAMILAGEIRVDGQVIDKPGRQIDSRSSIEYVAKVRRFVSRGGGKLAGALEITGLNPAGAVAVDVGSSTGGFTDVLLQKGAKRVYAVDVGKGLLDYKLRDDERVVVLEGVNARYLDQSQIPEMADMVVIDVSFISLAHIFPAVIPLLKPEGVLLPMIKPQFEAGRDQVPRGGVVRDRSIIAGVLQRVTSILYNEQCTVTAISPSRVKGPKGNQEYFALAVKRPPRMGDPDVEAMIEQAIYE